MSTLQLALGIFTLLLLVCGYFGVPFWAWTLFLVAALWVFGLPLWGWVPVGILSVVFNVPILRQRLVTTWIMRAIQAFKLLPNISDTECAAIEAGTVWVDGEFFSGQPDLQRLLHEPYPQPTPEIQAFLDGPVEQVCRMASDWEIYRRNDLPPELWAYLKQERFFGMIIPQEYGGLGFSNLAYSAVMTKLASRSFIHTATVGVTNSLGPAKLLLRYGTPDQKAYYLPRLARGEEIPCFALTEPMAGSDAANITAEGVVFQDDVGQRYICLHWQKRYITLGTIATLIGLAFRLRDPENILGKGEDVGITCALIARNTPGIVIDQRHDPMGVPFYNSPIAGHDVVIPIEQIIGGVEQAGQGWKMLMQSLAAGRGISFPATCTGVAQLVARVTGAYATVRKQFGLPIGRFEGIEEPLARIGGLTYVMDAARLYTCGAVDQGEQPAVISAIAKYNLTELARKIVVDGMDILGGAGICRGPRNLLANIYTAIPIPITVEGANILTRSMMIFGQGVIRCHPYVYSEITALNQSDVKGFDTVFWSHVGSMVRNSFRAVLLNLSRGRFAVSPTQGPTARYYRKLAWASATFALLADVALIGLGGTLKRREKIAGRFADALSWMYLGTATLRRFAAEGQQADDLPYVHWAMQYTFAQIQQAFVGILHNLPIPILGALFRGPIAAWWQLNPIGMLPTDALGHDVAQSLQSPEAARDRLTSSIYRPTDLSDALGRLEQAFALSVKADKILKHIKTTIQFHNQSHQDLAQQLTIALEAGLITQDELELIHQAASARNDVIQVDAFTLNEYQAGRQRCSLPNSMMSRSDLVIR